jgi:hypothetical protein
VLTTSRGAHHPPPIYVYCRVINSEGLAALVRSVGAFRTDDDRRPFLVMLLFGPVADLTSEESIRVVNIYA